MFCEKCQKDYNGCEICPVCQDVISEAENHPVYSENEIELPDNFEGEKALIKAKRKIFDLYTISKIAFILIISAIVLFVSLSSNNKEQKNIFENDLFSNGMVAVCKGEKWGYADKNGNEIIPLTYEQAFNFTENLGAVKKDGKVGFINKKNEAVIPFKYDNASSFKNGFAIVQKDKKFGFINKKGVEITKIEFDIAGEFNNGYAVASKDNMYFYINEKGEKAFGKEFNIAETFYEKMAAVCIDNKWGFINTKGEIIIKPKYTKVLKFSEGFCAVLDKNKWGYVDKNGKEICKPQFAEVQEFSEGYAVVKKQDNSYCFLNKKGEIETLLSLYQEVHPLRNGVSLARYKDKFGYINYKGDVIIPFDYDMAQGFINDIAIVKQGTWCCYININNEKLFDYFKIAGTSYFNDGYTVYLDKNKKMGIFDKKGNKYLADKYDAINPETSLLKFTNTKESTNTKKTDKTTEKTTEKTNDKKSNNKKGK